MVTLISYGLVLVAAGAFLLWIGYKAGETNDSDSFGPSWADPLAEGMVEQLKRELQVQTARSKSLEQEVAFWRRRAKAAEADPREKDRRREEQEKRQQRRRQNAYGADHDGWWEVFNDIGFDFGTPSGVGVGARASGFEPGGSAWSDLFEEARRWQEFQEQQRQSSRRRNGGPVSWAEILGVSPTASKRDIRQAYRRKVRECHPDRGGNHEDMVNVNAAWEAAKKARGIE